MRGNAKEKCGLNVDRLFASPEELDITEINRRCSTRLLLRIPAKLVSVFETQDCLLVDVSQIGALIRVARPLAIDACGYLRAGPLEAFAIAVRSNADSAAGPISGVWFDQPLTAAQVMYLQAYALRQHRPQENFSGSISPAWVSGAERP